MRRVLLFVLLAGVLAPAGAGRARERAGGLRWRTIPAGEAEARKTGKPALYFFTAEGCGPCHDLQNELFSDAKVAAAVEKRYIPIRCEDRYREDGANPPGFDDLARRYGLRAFPTLVVSRPGSGKGIRMTGWGGIEATREFLDVAASRLVEGENEEGQARTKEARP